MLCNIKMKRVWRVSPPLACMARHALVNRIAKAGVGLASQLTAFLSRRHWGPTKRSQTAGRGNSRAMVEGEGMGWPGADRSLCLGMRPLWRGEGGWEKVAVKELPRENSL